MIITIKLNEEELSYLNAFMDSTLKVEGLKANAAVGVFQHKINDAIACNNEKKDNS